MSFLGGNELYGFDDGSGVADMFIPNVNHGDMDDRMGDTVDKLLHDFTLEAIGA